LAGHAADPDAVRARIRAFARKHGLKLPSTAMKGMVDDDVDDQKPASRVKALVQAAYTHASAADGEYGSFHRRQAVEQAQNLKLAHHLPDDAHGFMHSHQMPHDHGDGAMDHAHVVKKARNVVVKFTTIEKAWDNDAGDCVIEGWVSTDDPDSEHDVVPPEAFAEALDGYAQRRMPLSSEHQMAKHLPIGHGQHIALVREGKVFKAASHPTDPADFEHFPNTGTGVYGRYVITDPQHATSVRKGNVGGFSWVGNLTEYEPLSTGGRKFSKIEPWLESTIAAYPVNTKAVLLAAKSYEAELPQEESVDPVIEKLLADAQAAVEAERAASQAPQPASPQAMDLAPVVEKAIKLHADAAQAEIAKQVEAAVQKALESSREGVGRVAVPVEKAQPSLESDALAFLVEKAHKVNFEDAEALTQDEKDTIVGFWNMTFWGDPNAAIAEKSPASKR
jgi:hypothetical protein